MFSVLNEHFPSGWSWLGAGVGDSTADAVWDLIGAPGLEARLHFPSSYLLMSLGRETAGEGSATWVPAPHAGNPGSIPSCCPQSGPALAVVGT